MHYCRGVQVWNFSKDKVSLDFQDVFIQILAFRLGPRVKKIKNAYPESSKVCYSINLKKYIWCIRKTTV